jgi:NAD(P)-dependent dehydrogenase (short-subunit alcohol dehydrogenase family)
MKTVVITGSTRGIGLALAKEFAQRGHRVIVSGRTEGACKRAIDSLGSAGIADHVKGIPCDVLELSELRQLWNRASVDHGPVDIWINNAGQSHGTHLLWRQPPERIKEVIGTNLIGLMQGCHVAVNGMLEQGYGAIYNLSGFGRTGLWRAGMAIYGTSKRGVDYFTKALARELRDTTIIVGQINPGMIVTDMLREGYDTSVQTPESVERTYNILADTADDAAPYLVDRLLANKKNGVMINRRPRYKVIARLLAAPFMPKRQVFLPEQANTTDHFDPGS